MTTTWDRPRPEQVGGDWLLAKGEEFVLRGMQIDDDWVHLSFALKLSTDAPLPVIDALSQRVRDAIMEAIETEIEFEGEAYLFTKGDT